MIITYLHTVIEAVVAGITLSFMLGPAFFTVMQISIEKGVRPATRFALGVFISDAILITLCIVGASQFFGHPTVNKIIGVAGGVLLMVFGVYSIRKKVSMEALAEKTLAENKRNWLDNHIPVKLQNVMKGFFMNLANPAVWIFWLVTVSAISAQYTDAKGIVVYIRVILFFFLTIATVFFMDILISYLAAKLKKIINAKVVKMVNTVVGVILIVFGAYLLSSTLGLFVLPEKLNLGQGVDIVKTV